MEPHAAGFTIKIFRTQFRAKFLTNDEMLGIAWDAFIAAIQSFKPTGGKSFKSWWYGAIKLRMLRDISAHGQFYQRFPTYHVVTFYMDGGYTSDLEAFVATEGVSKKFISTKPVPKTHDTRKLLTHTTKRRAQALRLRYIKGLPLPVVGKKMGITKNAANQNILRGLSDLRGKMTSEEARELSRI